MSKTKKIYFLSAIVLIIGCYALNLSYSLFVQTEERQALESVIPSLSCELSIPSITLEGNKEYLIKETITNTSVVSINYIIDSIGTDYEVKLLDKDNNELNGTLEPNGKKEVYLYIKNNSESENTVSLVVNTNYTTLNNDLVSNISSVDKYTAKKTAIPYYDKENTLAYNVMNKYVGEVELEEAYLTYEEIDNLMKNNDKLLLPIYNDNIVSAIDGNIFKTNDNYGISYYYVGNVDNNYVKLNDTLWRIVRINGDGSVRLISNNVIDNTIYNDIEKDNTYNGTIKEIIDKWYEDNLNDYNELLSDSMFCVKTSETLDINTDLICEDDNVYTVNNEKLKYPIGLLSIEEAVFGGLDGYLGNDNIWTMSSYKDNDIFVINNKTLATDSKDKEYGVKPVINLKSDTLVSGDGTEFNPYIINIIEQ